MSRPQTQKPLDSHAVTIHGRRLSYREAAELLEYVLDNSQHAGELSDQWIGEDDDEIE